MNVSNESRYETLNSLLIENIIVITFSIKSEYNDHHYPYNN